MSPLFSANYSLSSPPPNSNAYPLSSCSSTYSSPSSSCSSLKTLAARPSVVDYFSPKLNESELPSKQQSAGSPLLKRKVKPAPLGVTILPTGSSSSTFTDHPEPAGPRLPTQLAHRKQSISPSSPLYQQATAVSHALSSPERQPVPDESRLQQLAPRKLSFDMRSASTPDIQNYSLPSPLPLPSPSLSVIDDEPGHIRMSKTGPGGARRRVRVDESGEAYASFESCINGALAHEKQAEGYGDAPEAEVKALYHFTRANDLLTLALEQRPEDFEALIYKASVTYTLANRFYLPSEALLALQAIRFQLRSVLSYPETEQFLPSNLLIAARSQEARCTYLLATLCQEIHLSLVPKALWAGECGELAREAVKLWQAVAEKQSDLVQVTPMPSHRASFASVDLLSPEPQVRERRRSSIANKPVEDDQLVDTYLELSKAAAFCAGLTVDVLNTDQYFDISESAIECALKLASHGQVTGLTLPSYDTTFLTPVTEWFTSESSYFTSTTHSANVFSILLKVGPLKMNRIRHTHHVCPQLPLNQTHVSTILSGIGALAAQLCSIYSRTSSEPVRLSRAEAKYLTSQAYFNLGHAHLSTAHLLKRAWRKKALAASSKASNRRESHSRNSSTGSVDSEPQDGEKSSKPEEGGRRWLHRSRSSASLDHRVTIREEEEEEEEEEDEETAALCAKVIIESSESHTLSPSRCMTPTPSPIPNKPTSVESPQPPFLKAPMSMAQYRRSSAISNVSSVRSINSDDDASHTTFSASDTLSWTQLVARLSPGGPSTPGKPTSPPPTPTTPTHPQPTPSSLAEAAWGNLASSIQYSKLALSLSKSPSEPVASSLSITPTSVSLQRAEILLSIAKTLYFRATLAPRVAAAKDGRASLLASAEAYAVWTAKEVGWGWILEGKQRPKEFLTTPGQRNVLVNKSSAIGQTAIFTLLRTIWFKAVTALEGEVPRGEKQVAKERVETVVVRLRSELNFGSYDLTRFKIGVETFEDDFEQAEGLFWSGVSRTLRENVPRAQSISRRVVSLPAKLLPPRPSSAALRA